MNQLNDFNRISLIGDNLKKTVDQLILLLNFILRYQIIFFIIIISIDFTKGSYLNSKKLKAN